MVVTVRKGSKLEYEVVWDLQKTIDPTARRSSVLGKTSRTSGYSVDGDIMTKLPFCIECKFHESLKGFYKHWDQATDENKNPVRRASVLIIKASNRPKLATMDFGDWVELVSYALKAGYPD